MAIIMAAIATMRPSVTERWPPSLSIPKEGATSTVKMVEMLLHIDAREETIAASSAAKTRPLIPSGSKFIADG